MFTSTILPLIVGLVGIVSTIVAWKFNPKRKLYVELDEIYEKLEDMYAVRDKALKENDMERLTAVSHDFRELRARKNTLLQRLRQGI